MSTEHSTRSAWANPTPAGLVGLAVACFCFFPYLTGLVGKVPGEVNAMPLMAAWLLGGFIIQVIVALLDLKSGNTAGGNTFLFFSAFFMLAGAIEFLFKSFAPGLDTRIDGYAWLVLSITIWLWAPAFYKGSSLLFLIVATLCLACPMIAVVDLQILPAGAAVVCANIAAYALLTGGIIGIYLAAVLVVNGTYGREVYPNPKPFYRDTAQQAAVQQAAVKK